MHFNALWEQAAAQSITVVVSLATEVRRAATTLIIR